MLQSQSLPSHFISISSQEAGNNLQINCHFYGAEPGGWDSFCPPIKDDVAMKKIKGKFPPHILSHCYTVQYIISVWCSMPVRLLQLFYDEICFHDVHAFSGTALSTTSIEDLQKIHRILFKATTCCKSKFKSVAFYSGLLRIIPEEKLSLDFCVCMPEKMVRRWQLNLTLKIYISYRINLSVAIRIKQAQKCAHNVCASFKVDSTAVCFYDWHYCVD